MSFSPDGRRVLTLANRALRVWDATTGQPLTPPLVLTNPAPGSLRTGVPTHAEFRSDGRAVLALVDRQVVVWDLTPKEGSPDDLLRWAQLVTGRRLDPSGSINLLTTEEHAAVWRDLHSHSGDDGAATARSTRAWQEHEATACEASANWTGAAVHLTWLLAASQEDGQLFRRRGRSHFNLHHWEAATADYGRALALADPGLSPDDRAAVHRWRGWACAELGRWREVDDELARAADLRPGDAQLAYQRAAACLGAGDLDGGRRACAALLEQVARTDDQVALDRLLYAWVSAPDTVPDRDRLVRLAEAARAKNQLHVRILGPVLYRAGRYDEALKLLEEYARSNAPRGWDWLFQSMAHHRLGHAAAARRCLEQAARWIEDAADPADGPGARWAGWFERNEVAQLRREAEALLKGP